MRADLLWFSLSDLTEQSSSVNRSCEKETGAREVSRTVMRAAWVAEGILGLDRLDKRVLPMPMPSRWYPFDMGLDAREVSQTL
jgi:hypothetical protein